jgi:histone-lysine N-methyltransferase SETMAR
MLDLIQGLGRKQQKYFTTRNGSWIYWDIWRRGMWAQDRDELSPNMKQTISSKKTIVSAYFLRCGFVLVEFLPMRQRYNSQFFTETVLPSIERRLTECRPTLRTIAAHDGVDNATPHTSKMCIEKIEELGFILVPQPAHSSALVPGDFFLFGHLKHHLEGKQFTREDRVISAVSEVFERILLQTLQIVMDD